MYTKINSDFWRDEKLQELSRDSVYVFFYLLTNPHRNMAGLYLLPLPYAAFDLKMGEIEICKRLEDLCKAGLIDYDYGKSMVLVKNFLKHSQAENPNQLKSLENIVKKLPDTALLLEFGILLQDINEEQEGKLDSIVAILQGRTLSKFPGNGSKLLSEQLNKPLFNPLETVSEPFSKPLNNPSETLNEGLSKPFLNKKEVLSTKKEEEERSTGSENPPEFSETAQKEKIPYEKIMDTFNNFCTSLPKVIKLTPERRRKIRIVWNASKDYQNLEFFIRLFTSVEESDFLSGRRGTWQASFDWLLSLSVIQKILEGNYRNNKPGNGKFLPSSSSGYSPEEEFKKLFPEEAGEVVNSTCREVTENATNRSSF